MSISVLDMHEDPSASALFPAKESGNLLYVDDSVKIASQDMLSHAKVINLQYYK